MAGEFLMKGKVWSERKHLVKYPVVAEVKYDEIRLHVKLTDYGIEFLSYDGNPLNNLSEWKGQFADVMNEYGLSHLDMGVLVNKNFNDSYRWVRTKEGYPKEKLNKKTGKIAPELFPSMVEFYVFDVPENDGQYLERVSVRASIVASMKAIGMAVHFPKGIVCSSEEEVDSAFITFRNMGEEGAMVKSLGHKYQIGKRIDGWLKMKPEAEADGIIIGFIEAISEDGMPLGRAGSVIVEMPDKSRASPYGMDHTLAALMWNNQGDYIGQWTTFNYMERDRAGGYRHPTWGRLRESK